MAALQAIKSPHSKEPNKMLWGREVGWGACSFQIDIQGAGWPKTQNSNPHQPRGAGWEEQSPPTKLSAASSLHPNHGDTEPGGEGCLSSAVREVLGRTVCTVYLEHSLNRTSCLGSEAPALIAHPLLGDPSLSLGAGPKARPRSVGWKPNVLSA